ncbi:hypothetical protein ABZX98_07440 [Streptomyces sp. NPDC002992]|uniref:hypothetical protein n=1 Tax=Streptomyces sp. NPDC002992 TaxID=3154273 RepID=UPI0033AD419A
MTQPIGCPTISAEQFSRIRNEVRAIATPGMSDRSMRDCALRIVQITGLALSTDDLGKLLTALDAPQMSPVRGTPGYPSREEFLAMASEPPEDDEGQVR